MKKSLIVLLSMFIISACKQNIAESEVNINNEEQIEFSAVEQKINALEKAHNKKAFLDKEVIKFDIDLNFGGNDRLDGTIYMSTDSKYVRIDKTDGTSLLFDGQNVWMTPDTADDQGARFDMFTWSYFFALPYKLQDPGTITELQKNTNEQDIIRLTFENGTGDAPDDWYEIYTNEGSKLIDYAGYIVTYGGTPADKAEQNAHAIGYEGYQKVDNITIAHRWKFYNYSNTVDTSSVIGTAVLTNLEFIKLDLSLFTKPNNAADINL